MFVNPPVNKFHSFSAVLLIFLRNQSLIYLIFKIAISLYSPELVCACLCNPLTLLLVLLMMIVFFPKCITCSNYYKWRRKMSSSRCWSPLLPCPWPRSACAWCWRLMMSSTQGRCWSMDSCNHYFLNVHLDKRLPLHVFLILLAQHRPT